jgi:subtilisin
MLVEIRDQSAETLQRQLPEGTRVFEEFWYRLDRTGAPWLWRTGRKRAMPPAGTGGRNWIVRVSAGDAGPLPDVTVTLLLGGRQLTAVSSASGIARFRLPLRSRRIDRLYVDPLHSAWPVYRDDVAIEPKGLALEVPALGRSYADTRNLVYGLPEAGGGGVFVAVVDSGVGPHRDLAVVGGRNTTELEPHGAIDDWMGHGTHVAGVIAARASGRRRGEASQVSLLAFRVFQKNGMTASNFWIRNAINEAADAGCCLANLSLGGGDPDPGVMSAVQMAWDKGCVCVAAAGNDGAATVDVPARYRNVLAVSAIGLEGAWPPGTTHELETVASPARGREIAGRRVFVTGFSNHGPEVSLTAPGSAIVSTLPGDRYGVMSGTSMATPIATGVLARRIAAAGVHRMAPDGRRAAAVVALARAHAEKLGLPATMQGYGLAH